MPKVDVIMPAYNAARYLPTAIESVIAQSFEDWQIQLVDDGSTDNTAEVVAPFVERLGPKLNYIRQPNGGVSAARNTAIRNSSADLLAMLDADDVWDPCRLSESLKCFEGRPQVGLSYGFNTLIDLEGRIVRAYDSKQKNGEGRIASYIYMRRVDLPCCTVTFRRECVDEVGMFDEALRVTEDRDLWLRIALRYEVALVPKLIAHYRTSPDSLTKNPERMLNAQMQFIEKHYGAPGCGTMARRIALSRIYKQHAEGLSVRQQPWAALMSSLRAVALYPLEVNNLRTAGSLVLRCAGINL